MNDILKVWQEWEIRNDQHASRLVLYSDGSGEFDEKDLYGPVHEFNNIKDLKKILLKQ